MFSISFFLPLLLTLHPLCLFLISPFTFLLSFSFTSSLAVFCFLSVANSRSDAGLTGSDVRQKALLSGWAKKYVVVEIPPYCRQRGGDGDGEVDGKNEGDEEVYEEEFGESWSPMVPSSERDSGEAMDCSSSLEEEEEPQRGTNTCHM